MLCVSLGKVCVLFLSLNVLNHLECLVLTDETLYYRGVNCVKVLTKSDGYWIVEAMEDFEDYDDEKRILVKKGEQRIVPPDLLHRTKTLPPIVPEHVYERKMEKKVKQMVEDQK
jgi:hypothetical protein